MKKAAVSFRLTDGAVQALAAKLAALSRSVAVQALRKGMGEVTKEVLGHAKQLVPRRRGQLRKSLGRSVKVLRGGKGVIGKVGPRGGFKIVVGGKPIDPAKYAHLVEYGRRAITSKKVMASKADGKFFGRHVRAVAPHPFMRPAWDAVRPRVSEILSRHLQDGIRKFFAKHAARRAA